MESIKKEHSPLSEVLAFKCPLCGNMLAQDKFNQAMNEFNDKTQQMFKLALENEKIDYEKREKLIVEKHKLEKDDIKKIHSSQIQSMTEEFKRSNESQQNKLQQHYENLYVSLRKQLETSNKEAEQRLTKVIESKDTELDGLKENLEAMKKSGVEEGKKIAMEEVQTLKMKILQKDIQLARLNNDLEKLKSGTASTQSELKGEAGEIDLYSVLKKAFPDDDLERQKRGSSSGDIIQHIKTNSVSVEIPIVFDNKESSSVTKLDLEKAKRYRIIHKTNYVIIVSKYLPKQECSYNIIGEKDGILLVHPLIVVEFVQQVRKFLIDISREKISQRNRQSKEAHLFDFIKSHEFARKLSTLYEIYKKSKVLQVKEEKDHQTLWKTRNSLTEELRDIYIEISGQIDSIIQNISTKDL